MFLCLALLLSGCQSELQGYMAGDEAQAVFSSAADTTGNPGTFSSEGEPEKMQNIEIKIGQSTYSATLYENETVKSLVELLPLEVNMQDLNGNEKYFYLSQSLPCNAQPVSQIRAGDLMLFGSDCLVLFYKDFTTTYRYTKIGKLETVDGLEEALGYGAVRISFQLTE